jgi:dihydrofolate synthase/folylpolyglutamate synthase
MTINLEKWLEEKIGFEQFNPGLERIKAHSQVLIETINQSSSKIVTVAGTNGKGETCHRLTEILNKKGLSYCLWTSPHLISVTERFQSENGEIEPEILLQKFEVERSKSTSHQLSYYEFLFAAFLRWVADKKPEYIILEVGLGGRLDAVNCLDAKVAAIVSISRDHQEFLGNKLVDILGEKYAITRKKGSLVTAMELGYLRDRLKKWTTEDEIYWQDLFQQEILDREDDFSTRNKMMAMALFQLLEGQKKINITRDKLSEFAEKESRQKQIEINQRTVELIGSHNIDGLRKLVQFLYRKTYNCNQDHLFKALCVSFSKRDKVDMENMLRILASYPCLFEKIYITDFNHFKAQDRSLLETMSEKVSVEFLDNWKVLIESEEYKNSSILFSGSYYFIGNIYKDLVDSFPSSSSASSI